MIINFQMGPIKKFHFQMAAVMWAAVIELTLGDFKSCVTPNTNTTVPIYQQHDFCPFTLIYTGAKNIPWAIPEGLKNIPWAIPEKAKKHTLASLHIPAYLQIWSTHPLLPRH
jgi:hypothetical protein